MTEIEKLKEAVAHLESKLCCYPITKEIRVLLDFARIAVKSAGKWPRRTSYINSGLELTPSRSAYAEGWDTCEELYLPAHTAILAEERSKSLPSKEELQDIIQDINFESYGFSHEEVAAKTAEAIHSAMLKKRGE